MAKKSFKKRANIFKGESNPFNVKVNREKHRILGQKVKGTKGLPVVSKAESQAKRRELWHKTKVKVQKANRFVDKRLMDGSLPLEESKVNSFIKEQKRKFRKNIFNLNDEEELTHLGLSLQDVKSFEDKGSSSEDEGQLGPSFVQQAHFGGFNAEHKEQPKSHKEIMEDLIVESKQKKHEKKIEKELTADMTEKLDKDWKNVLSLISSIKTSKPVESIEKNDPYDVITKELKYDMKATPAACSKTIEELEKEEGERLKKLEQEKQLRMMEDDTEATAQKARNHVSADAIDDDFDLQPIGTEDDTSVSNTVHLNEFECSDSEESDISFASEQVNDKLIEDDSIEIHKKESSVECDDSSSIPKCLEEFEHYLNSIKVSANNPDEVYKAIEDILKDKIKSKSAKMLSKLDTFFSILIEYALKCVRVNIEVTSVLPPLLFTLADRSPLHTGLNLLSFLDHEQSVFIKQKKKKNYPSIKTLLILKYCSVLYSVSDFRHPVVTPAMIFMCDILASPCVLTVFNVTSRLIVCGIVLDCISESKRFVPEALRFLRKVLNMAAAEISKAASRPMKTKEINLVINENLTEKEITELNFLSIRNSVCDDDKKLSIISLVIKQLLQFSNLYIDLPSYLELFSPVLTVCNRLPIDRYPPCLQDSLAKLKEIIVKKPGPMRNLVYQNTKPKPLKLFEPAFESKYNSKKDDVKKKFKLLKSVSQKIRKEEKCILREMRRDTQMIGAEKLKERLELDAERKRKVKELYHDLAVQEGEYKKMMKKK